MDWLQNRYHRSVPLLSRATEHKIVMFSNLLWLFSLFSLGSCSKGHKYTFRNENYSDLGFSLPSKGLIQAKSAISDYRKALKNVKNDLLALKTVEGQKFTDLLIKVLDQIIPKHIKFIQTYRLVNGTSEDKPFDPFLYTPLYRPTKKLYDLCMTPSKSTT